MFGSLTADVIAADTSGSRAYPYPHTPPPGWCSCCIAPNGALRHMRIASRWAKTGSLLRCWAIPSTHGSMYCGLGTSRPRAAAAAYATGLYGRLYGIRLYFAVFRCMTLHTCITHRHAFPPAPYSHTAPYSAIQRHTALYEHTAIQHHTAYTPYNTPQYSAASSSGSGSSSAGSYSEPDSSSSSAPSLSSHPGISGRLLRRATMASAGPLRCSLPSPLICSATVTEAPPRPLRSPLSRELRNVRNFLLRTPYSVLLPNSARGCRSQNNRPSGGRLNNGNQPTGSSQV